MERDVPERASAQERAALVALLRVRPGGLRKADVTAEVVAAGSARAVWDEHAPLTLIAAPGEPDPLAEAAADLADWEARGHTMVTVLDRVYPERLRGVHEAPAVLFVRGTLLPREPAVSVVGSRAASPRGLEIAAGVARELTARGVTVVSGLALGVDAAAHRAALDAGGRTVAVIGTGIERVYPAAHRELHAEIASRGLLLSQFWPSAAAQKHTFPLRNATMSGFGLATVVVEAGEQSGARIQARSAVAHGRPVIFTDLVADRNQWARDLVGRPGVYVVSGMADTMSLVEGFMAEEARAQEAFRALVSL
ncbi:hypothetical protein GCM10022221_53580 [Actinocorallia aurea]